MAKLTADQRAALEALFGSEGWAYIIADARSQIENLERVALNAPSFEILVYNRGVRDTLRALTAYDRILEFQEQSEDDPV